MEETGRATPASSAANGGSKPTTPIPTPSPPTPSQQQTQTSNPTTTISNPSSSPSISSSPSALSGSVSTTPVTSQGPPSRYGYGPSGPPPVSSIGPIPSMHPATSASLGPGSSGGNQAPPGPPQTNHTGAMLGAGPHSHLSHHPGGYPPPPHGSYGPPPPGHHPSHHHQYMSPMMMPPPSQYPNKPPPPGGPPPPMSHVGPPPGPAGPPVSSPQQQQHVPSYGNYGPPPPPPPHRMSGPLPPHHGGSGNAGPPYYSMRHPHHQMPPHQQQQMNKSYVGYPNSGGYPGGLMGGPPNHHPNSSSMPPQQHVPPPTHPAGPLLPHNHPQHHQGGPPLHPHQPIPPNANSPMLPTHPHHPQMPPTHPSHHPNVYGQSAGGHSLQQHTNESSQLSSTNSTNVNNSSQSQSSASSSLTTSSSAMVSNNSNTQTTPSTTVASNGHNLHNRQTLQPQPPSIMDEVSQTSTTSSQDRAEDSCASGDMPTSSSSSGYNNNNNTTKSHNPKSHHPSLSHPPTPNTSNLGSPGAASLSSFHDDFDSVSSPSWPRTPASPAINSSSQYDSHIVHNSKRPDNVQKLYEMSDEPDRKLFLDKYFQFLDERGTPLNQVPTISKIPVDLYRLYMLVKERGGYLEVTRSKMWKDCAQLCNIANSSSASYTLRKQYMKHLLPFECKFDRGGIDVGPLLSAADAANVNRKKSAAQSKLTNSGRSTPTTPRLSPNDSPSTVTGAGPYHPGHHPHPHQHPGIHPGYPPEMDPSQNSYGPGPGSASPYHPHPPQQQGPPGYPPPHPDYHHNTQQYGPSTGSQPNAGPGQSNSAGPNHHQNNIGNHESVSVKDPFADEDPISSSSPARVSKSSTPNQYTSSRAQQHYPMPNNTGSYYGQGGPPGQNSQPPGPCGQPTPHTNNYPPPPPETGGASHYPPDQQGSYPQRSNSSALDGGSPTSGQSPFGSRMGGMNGPMHPHHHGPYYGHGSYQQQQHQVPQGPSNYPEHPSGPTGSSGHPPPPSPSGRSTGPYDQHHNQHAGYPPPGHRYPSIPNNVGAAPGNYPNLNRHAAPSVGGSGLHPGVPHSHHSSPGGSGGLHQPPSGQQAQPPYPPPNTPGSQQESPGAGGYPPGVGPGVKNSEAYNSAIRMQSPLAQRLLAAKLSQSSATAAAPAAAANSSTNNNVTNSNNNNQNTLHNQQNFPGSQQQQQYGPASNSSSGNGNVASSPTPSSATSSAPSIKPSTSSALQVQTNISWMSSQNVRYPQPKRHPDFVKQAPPTPLPPDVSPYPPTSPYPTQHYSNSSPAVGPRGPMPPPGSSPPNAAVWNAARENHQYRMPGHAGGFYQQPGYQNSSPHVPPPSHSSQRDPAWHDSSRGGSQTVLSSSSTPTNSIDSPMTTAHWSSNRYPPGSYPEYGNSGHYPGSSSSHPNVSASAAAGSKIMQPSAMVHSQFGIRPPVDQQNSRSNFGIPRSHSGAHGIYPTPASKMPSSMINSSSSSSQQPHSLPNVGLPYGSPYGTSTPHGSGSTYGATGSGGGHHSSPLMRPRETTTIFPSNSVEATIPTPNKRRKLVARDIAPVEAWRIYMSLKSGLLAESTFALDVLSVYSNDDNTLIYLSLPNMPGLLEVLLEHYRRYLNEMFDAIFEDIEIGFEDRLQQQQQCNGNGMINNGNDSLNDHKKHNHSRPLKWYELDRDLYDSSSETNYEDDEDIEQFLDRKFKLNGKPKLTLFQDSTSNYTNVTRSGKLVKVKKDKNLFIMDYDKKWDPSRSGFNTGCEHWQKGGGETTTHIQSHMEPKEKYLRFCRLIKSQEKRKQPSSADGGSERNDGDERNNQDSGVKMTNGDSPSNMIINGHQNNKTLDDDLDRFLNSDTDEYPKIHPTDRESYWKRLHQPDFEDESYDQEEPAVCTGREYQDSIKSRCLTVSNLIRNLTFVPGNDLEMCRNSCLLLILSRLILLHHVHALKKKRKISEIDCTKISANRLDEETMFNLIEEKPDDQKSCSDRYGTNLQPEKEWWWEALHLIRENTMVTLANISGQLDLSTFPESITLALLDGLLHWAICPSSYAQDSFPSAPMTLSPRRLAYEALSKLSIYESNVDLILATPPWSRIEKFLKNLTRSLVRNEDQTIREFSIVLISNFATADPSVVRVIALSGYSVSLLLGFIEQAEQSALNMANTHGIQYLRENFDAIGTTPDMVRRAAAILRTLARYSENRSLFIQHEQRLLSLSMSQILDPSISFIIADILYECSFETSTSSVNNHHHHNHQNHGQETTIVPATSANQHAVFNSVVESS